MDAGRFDALTRRIGSRTTRRIAIGLGVTGLLAITTSGADALQCSRQKPCPDCKKCKKRRCRRDTTQNGLVVPLGVPGNVRTGGASALRPARRPTPVARMGVAGCVEPVPVASAAPRGSAAVRRETRCARASVRTSAKKTWLATPPPVAAASRMGRGKSFCPSATASRGVARETASPIPAEAGTRVPDVQTARRARLTPSAKSGSASRGNAAIRVARFVRPEAGAIPWRKSQGPLIAMERGPISAAALSAASNTGTGQPQFPVPSATPDTRLALLRASDRRTAPAANGPSGAPSPPTCSRHGPEGTPHPTSKNRDGCGAGGEDRVPARRSALLGIPP